MKLRIAQLWSPDLDPPSSGTPVDRDFDLLLNASVAEVGQEGAEVFECRVCTPSALAATPGGRFVTATLVLDDFSWEAVRERLATLLRQCDGSADWGEAIRRLSPYLRYSDGDA